MATMRTILAFALLTASISASAPARAQQVFGVANNAGRLPATMMPGSQPLPTMPAPSGPITPPIGLSNSATGSYSAGSRYPDTETLSRYRIESQGYRVD